MVVATGTGTVTGMVEMVILLVLAVTDEVAAVVMAGVAVMVRGGVATEAARVQLEMAEKTLVNLTDPPKARRSMARNAV